MESVSKIKGKIKYAKSVLSAAEQALPIAVAKFEANPTLLNEFDVKDIKLTISNQKVKIPLLEHDLEQLQNGQGVQPEF